MLMWFALEGNGGGGGLSFLLSGGILSFPGAPGILQRWGIYILNIDMAVRRELF